MKSSRERASFKIQPTDGASAGWQTGLDSRKRALVSEEKKIVNNRYFFNDSPFWKLRIRIIIVFQF